MEQEPVKGYKYPIVASFNTLPSPFIAESLCPSYATECPTYKRVTAHIMQCFVFCCDVDVTVYHKIEHRQKSPRAL